MEFLYALKDILYENTTIFEYELETFQSKK